MDAVHESERPRYLLCGLGFGLLAVSFCLLALGSALPLAALLTRNLDLMRVAEERWWVLLVGLPMSYGALVGSYLLWGRWTDAGWQRRAGILVFMNLIDAVFSTLMESEALGFISDFPADSYFVLLGTGVFGWIELYLSAVLAADVAAQLGRPSIAEAGRLSVKMALGGLALWIVYFAARTDLSAGWPPIVAPIRSEGQLLLLLVVLLARVVSGVQVMTLCAVAAIQSRRTWRELVESDEGGSAGLPPQS